MTGSARTVRAFTLRFPGVPESTLEKLSVFCGESGDGAKFPGVDACLVTESLFQTGKAGYSQGIAITASAARGDAGRDFCDSLATYLELVAGQFTIELVRRVFVV